MTVVPLCRVTTTSVIAAKTVANIATRSALFSAQPERPRGLSACGANDDLDQSSTSDRQCQTSFSRLAFTCLRPRLSPALAVPVKRPSHPANSRPSVSRLTSPVITSKDPTDIDRPVVAAIAASRWAGTVRL